MTSASTCAAATGPYDVIYEAAEFLIRLLREDERLERLHPAARRETTLRHTERVAKEFGVPTTDLARVTADLISGENPVATPAASLAP